MCKECDRGAGSEIEVQGVGKRWKEWDRGARNGIEVQARSRIEVQ